MYRRKCRHLDEFTLAMRCVIYGIMAHTVMQMDGIDYHMAKAERDMRVAHLPLEVQFMHQSVALFEAWRCQLEAEMQVDNDYWNEVDQADYLDSLDYRDETIH